MSFAKLPGLGLWYPSIPPGTGGASGQSPFSPAGGFSPQLIDATGERINFCARVHIPGGGSKTFSSSGGKIHWVASARTWATAGSTIRIGVQDLAGTSPAHGDATWDVYKDLVQGTDSITAQASGYNTTAMASGSKTINDGDLIALCFEFTTRNGSDAVTILGIQMGSGGSPYLPACSWSANGSTWSNGAINSVWCALEFDDGTFAELAGTPWFHNTNLSYDYVTDSSNPDERGLIFRLPFACIVDAIGAWIHNQNGDTSDLRLRLYETPAGTPNALATVTLNGEENATTNTAQFVPAPIAATILKANTDYCIALKATSTGGSLMARQALLSAAQRVCTPYGSDAAYAYRNNDSGAFSTDTAQLAWMFLRATHIDVGPSPSLNIGGIC